MDRPARITPPKATPPSVKKAVSGMPSGGFSRFSSRTPMKVMDAEADASLWATTPPPPSATDEGREADTGHHMSSAERARTASVAVVAPAHSDSSPVAPLAFTVSFAPLGEDAFVLGVRHSVFLRMDCPNQISASLSVADTPLSASAGSGAGVTLQGSLHKLSAGAEGEAALSEYTQVEPADVPTVRRGEIVLMKFVTEAVTVVTPGGTLEDVDLNEFFQSQADPLALVAPGLVSHLGSDENGTLVLLCRAFAGQPTTTAATMTGIDQYGIDVMAATGQGRQPLRINFSKPVVTSGEVRAELAALARGARFKLGVG